MFLGPGEELEEEEQAWQTGEVIVSETRAWTPLQELALMLANFQDFGALCRMPPSVGSIVVRIPERRRQSKYQKTLERLEKFRFTASKHQATQRIREVHTRSSQAIHALGDDIYELVRSAPALLELEQHAHAFHRSESADGHCSRCAFTPIWNLYWTFTLLHRVHQQDALNIDCTVGGTAT